jgi:hypothetical protein
MVLEYVHRVYMEKINLDYVPPAPTASTSKTEKDKMKEQLEQLKNGDDLKNITDVFDVTDEEAKTKILPDDVNELIEKNLYLSSLNMPNMGYMKTSEVREMELQFQKTVGVDPVDIFENAQPSSEISVSKPQEVLDLQVKNLSLLQNQTGRRKEELKQVELNSKEYSNTKIKKDANGYLNEYGGVRESLDDVMRKYTEMVLGGDENMAKEFINIQREYENAMRDAHKQFEDECTEIQGKFDTFLDNKLGNLFDMIEADERDIDVETEEMLKDMKKTMKDVQDQLHDLAEEENKQMRMKKRNEAGIFNTNSSSSSSSDDDDNENDQDNDEYLQRKAMAAMKKLKEETKLLGDPDEYEKFRAEILHKNGYVVDDSGEIIGQVMAPPDIDKLIDEATGEELPSREELYGKNIKSWKDIKSEEEYTIEMQAKAERRQKIAEEKRIAKEKRIVEEEKKAKKETNGTNEE